MRNAFASEINVLAAADDRVVLLAGDIGNKLFDTYKAARPDRFLNCGVAEANMISVAAGMASCGLRPVAYTIAPFITTRCLEQIRVDVCYQNLPVIIAAVGAGLSYASLNATHHSCEDIAFLRMLPNMTVVCPGDAVEVRWALRSAMALEAPVYLRLGKKGEPVVHSELEHFRIGEAITVLEGDEVCLLSTGNVLPLAVQVGSLLAEEGVSARVVSMHTVKPLDEAMLNEVFANFATVATIEEHSRSGGFGGAVAEWLADQGRTCGSLLRIGTPDAFMYVAGEQEFARRYFGLSADQIASQIRTRHQQVAVAGRSPTHEH